MKRLHIHLSVDDLDTSVDFYTTLFGSAPGVLKPDYAKWALDDPRVNFAISQRARQAGLDHLGIQVDDESELQEVAGRLAASGAHLVEQKGTTCCYARSDKAWVSDPQGIAWETFRSHGETVVYGEDAPAEAQAGACCADQPCGTASNATAQSGACCA